MGEFELIDRYFTAGPVRPDVIAGVGDDAAILKMPPDVELLAAVDTLVEGRHFPVGSPAHSIGYRALAVNLSDIAAMGGTPAWATLALTIPRSDPHWLHEFSNGLHALAAEHDVSLVGGDTCAGPLSISLQILGHVERGSALRRCGARPGDLLAVTGTLGDAAAGLSLLMGRGTVGDPDVGSRLIRRFEYPSARVTFGRQARGLATAAMDLSDGLAGDLPRLAAASGVAAHVDVDRLPLSSELRLAVPPARARELALAGGDDYELLLAVPPSQFDALSAAARQLNLTLTVIGELRRGNGVQWALDGRPFDVPAGGYDHFR